MAEKWNKQGAVEFWAAEKEGDELIGEVVKIIPSTEDNFGVQYDIKAAGKEAPQRTPSHKVLQNRMADVKVGQTVKIVYTGETPAKKKNQNPTKMYDVFVRE